jgi:hypothetical protein
MGKTFGSDMRRCDHGCSKFDKNIVLSFIVVDRFRFVFFFVVVASLVRAPFVGVAGVAIAIILVCFFFGE